MNKKLFLAVLAIAGSATTFAVVNSYNSVKVSASTNPPIMDKMLNAIDNYKDVQGTYHIVEKPIQVDQLIDFKIKEGQNPGSYIKIKDTQSNSVIEQHSDGDYVLNHNYSKNEFTKTKINKSTTFFKTSQLRSFKNPDGTKVYQYRQDPAWASVAHEVSFPQEYAFWLTNNNDYKIIGQEKYLDRDATVIQGKMDPYIGKKQNAANFKMWVDSSTGILLKMLETDGNGVITNEIEVQNLKVDQGVDSTLFSTADPQGAINKSLK